MSEQDIELIDYRDYISSMMRITHETDLLQHVPDEQQVKEQVRVQGRKETIKDLKDERERRKQILAGLHVEVVEIDGLIDMVEEME